MPFNHLILCHPLLLLPPIPPSIRVFSNESTLCLRWPKYWSFSFSISPSNEHPGLISFRIDWLDLLWSLRDSQESSSTPQFKSINSSVLSFLHRPTLTFIHDHWQVQPLWRTMWRFLKKLEIELPYDPAIPLLGIHTEETRTERDTCTPMVIAALFIIARTWKQPSVHWQING